MHYYIVKDMTDEKEYRKITAQLTGPLLTDERRQRQLKAQAPDEPPMPYWWDDDEDASASSFAAARALGVQV